MRAPIDGRRSASVVRAGPARRHLGLRHHPRSAAARNAATRSSPRCRRSARGRHHPDRHRHAPRQHADASSSGCSGATSLGRCRVINHDSRDASTLGSVGTTSTGVEVRLNREWLDADVRITTGFVEPHFFAGFSGGPKMVAPGLAGLDTVMTLHDARRIGHPNATWGITEGNPIHDDVREIARMVPVAFRHRRDAQSRSADHGRVRRRHPRRASRGLRLREGHGDARGAGSRSIVVLTTNSGYPLDQNLYQAVKGMSAAAKIVKPGGTIICAAECRDGLPTHGATAQVLASQPDPGSAARDDQHAGLLAARPVAGADPGADSDEGRGAREDQRPQRRPRCAPRTSQPIDDVAAAVRDALRRAGPAPTLCVLPQGPQTIPYLLKVEQSTNARDQRTTVSADTLPGRPVNSVHLS